MGTPSALLTSLGAILIGTIAAGIIVWAAAQRRRAALHSVDLAREEAERVLRQAARDSDNLRKEAVLEAREKAHELAAEAERQARDRRQEMLGLEGKLAEKTRALAER